MIEVNVQTPCDSLYAQEFDKFIKSGEGNIFDFWMKFADEHKHIKIEFIKVDKIRGRDATK